MRQSTLSTVLSLLFLSALVTSMPFPNLLRKQTYSGRGTWFDVGLGACGETNVNSDSIVALPSWLYDNGVHCNTIAVTANGVTAYATVRDKCPGCSGYSLDMSPGLFQNFADLSVGVVEVFWHFT